MGLTNLVMLLVAVIVVLLALRPRVLRAPVWRATVTPLASIIGSGFLVVGPILAHTAGHWAWLAMAGLCLTGYLFGAAIRQNIRLVEPMLAGPAPKAVRFLDHSSEYVLAFAYFISVAYYLNLFASFALRAESIIDPELARWVTSAVIASLGLTGALRGLHGLENIEAVAVGIKLGLIAGLLAALTVWLGGSLAHGTLVIPRMPHETGSHQLGILLGLIILVQGFETSRYLGAEYDRATRIRTMRYAQLLSSVIYILFILLITPLFRGSLPVRGGETSIIEILAPLGGTVAPIIIFAALASQLSAAVADMNGAGGLLNTATAKRVTPRLAYAATAAVALAITWSANIYEIIVYASKAFVIYYGLQSALAALVAFRAGTPAKAWRALPFAAAALLAVLVLLFGIPADGA